MIYPNPATDFINIQIEGQIDYQVNLFNIEGKRMKSVQNAKQLNVSSLPVGTYILEIKDAKNGSTVVETIILQK